MGWATGGVALTGCAGDLSTLAPAGPYANAIANLWWVMLAGAALILAGVMALALLILFRPGFGRGLAARKWMIWGGLAFPIPVLLALMTYGMAQGEYLLGAWQQERVSTRVQAQGTMWRWQFRYPDIEGGLVTWDTLHIPAGSVVEVDVVSTDVVHSFWIPRLAGKIDAIPGHTTTLRIKADTPGSYGGVCAEYCGTGHAGMRFRVEAHAPEVYQQRLEEIRKAQGEGS